jgi:imidazoleglycerol-phosphate dehydratase/histidinol-phosphatase
MKQIFIDRNFFEFKNKKAQGLISGLSRFSRYSFSIFTEDAGSIDESIKLILNLERIVLNDKKKSGGNFDYMILLQGKSANNKIVAGKNSINNFADAVEKILQQSRSSVVKRATKETQIEINLELDGEGKSKIKTGIGFFDHMLEQIARHANVNLVVKIKGDLQVDEHHTVEDTGIALGEAIKKALGDKKGIKRYGYFIPMDESAAVCAIDLGGRNYLNFNCKFMREYVGEFPTELTKEFFRGLASGMAANIYLSAKGENDHHKIEAMFKAFAKSLNEACRLDERAGNSLPSTKGLL